MLKIFFVLMINNVLYFCILLLYRGAVIWEDDENVPIPAAPNSLPPSIRASILFLLLWQYHFCVSDSGIGVLFLFLYHLLKLFSQLTQSSSDLLVETFPRTLCKARSMIVGDTNLFCEYTVFPRCHAQS